jgi:hypothetical protein
MIQISALRPAERFGGWYWYKRTASWLLSIAAADAVRPAS